MLYTHSNAFITWDKYKFSSYKVDVISWLGLNNVLYKFYFDYDDNIWVYEFINDDNNHDYIEINIDDFKDFCYKY